MLHGKHALRTLEGMGCGIVLPTRMIKRIRYEEQCRFVSLIRVEQLILFSAHVTDYEVCDGSASFLLEQLAERITKLRAEIWQAG